VKSALLLLVSLGVASCAAQTPHVARASAADDALPVALTYLGTALLEKIGSVRRSARTVPHSDQVPAPTSSFQVVW
jgi:hypothetical protein